jgi:chromate transporter
VPTWLEVFWTFLKLGLTSFGGPVAHLGYFRREFVQRRNWLDETEYADIVALCQFLPGPASSQTGMAIGRLRAGYAGLFAAFVGFTLPSAVLMTAFAYGAPALRAAVGTGWLHGLRIAAIGVVGQAVLALARTVAPDLPRLGLLVVAAGVALLFPYAWIPLTCIGLGGLAGLVVSRRGPAIIIPPTSLTRQDKAVAAVALVLFFALLVVLPLWRSQQPGGLVAVIDAFYRTGALVFGGGHVVLPLLDSEVVRPGWIAPGDFLAGYGAAQAVPGPLFTFAAYLGAAIHEGPGGAYGALIALAAIFLPSILLLLGLGPLWNLLRGHPVARQVLNGANAAVAGLLLAVLLGPLSRDALQSPWDWLAAAGAFGLLLTGRVPAWLVVLVYAAGGVLVRR